MRIAKAPLESAVGVPKMTLPEQHIEAVQANLITALKRVIVGDPRISGVQLGPLVSRSQVDEVSNSVHQLSLQTPIVYQGLSTEANSSGAFFAPVLMVNERPLQVTATHQVEAFGPVCTLMPYHDIDEAIAITGLGKGSACSSVVTGDDKFAREFALATASHHERLIIVNKETADCSSGYDMLLPAFFNEGSARPGEGIGGMNGLLPFMKRTVVQAPPNTVASLTGVYQQGCKQTEQDIHLFRKHFEELEIGDTLITRKRTITAADISNFANLSWDHFYAHTDVTALEGSMFHDLVAHGYLILSAAAGLFVDSAKGPVLLNYGLEDCRFTKPVYAGTTIGVGLTVKEKLEQERRGDKDIAKGIVKFLVDVYDESGDTVAVATILTMVKKLRQ